MSIYDYDTKIENYYSAIKLHPNISETTAQLISSYHNAMVSEGLAKATQNKHLEVLYSLSKTLDNYEWKDITKQRVDDLVLLIMKKYADQKCKETHSSRDHKKVLKIFVRWLRLSSRRFADVGNPPEVNHVKLREIPSKITREDLVEDTDRVNLLSACGENLRDRAFISVQDEGGFRPGEILSCKIKHVKFDDKGAILKVDGKTGPRPVRLIVSVPDLAAWYNVNPYKNDREGPLWATVGKSSKPYLDYASAAALIRRVCRHAKIDKRINLKLFRHSEATSAANFMTEGQLKKRHGWSPNSRMPAIYTHLVNADVDNAIFHHYGIEINDEKKAKEKLLKICNICKMPNAPDSELCNQCGKPLDLKTAIEIEEQEKEKQKSLKSEIDELKQRLTRKEQEDRERHESILKLLKNEYQKGSTH